MRLSVIIVNYNVTPFLEQCILSVQAAAAGMDMEVIVVDNASADLPPTYIPTRFPFIRYIRNEENLGYSRANNQGLALATGDLLLLLNPDTLVPAGAFETVRDFFNTHPQAGALGMAMYDGCGAFLPESKRGLPDPWTAFYKLAGLARLFPRHPRFARYYLGHLPASEVQEVEVLAGAFLALTRTAFEKTGGLDERFFMYGEDIDFSHRIRLAGFRNYYLPEPGILHFKGESAARTTGSRQHFYEAMVIFAEKYFPSRAWLTRLLLRPLIRKWKNRAVAAETPAPAPILHFRATGDLAFLPQLLLRLPPQWQYRATGEVQRIICIWAPPYNWRLPKPEGENHLPVYFFIPGANYLVGGSCHSTAGESIPLKKNPG